MTQNLAVCQPDSQFFGAIAEKIVRLSKVPVDSVAMVSINFGSGSALGSIRLKNGELITVGGDDAPIF
jgi:hypothetical protein